MEERGSPLTRVVVDALLTAALILDDEATDRDDAILDLLSSSELFVPAHWPLEIASILLKAERQGRLPPGGRSRSFNRVADFFADVRIEPVALSIATVELAVASGLTAYDAAYLELALRLDATLGSNDGDLNDAARARGVSILTTRP